MFKNKKHDIIEQEVEAPAAENINPKERKSLFGKKAAAPAAEAEVAVEAAKPEKKKLSFKKTPVEPTPEELEAEMLKKKKRAKRKKVMRVIDRIFGFFIATGIVVGCACLALEYIIVKGPSPALRDTFVMTMLETRRFKFIPNIFLTEAEVKEISAPRDISATEAMDTTLINIPTEEENADDARALEDPDGDGIILETVHGSGYQGYMLIVLDPSRVFVGMPNGYGGVGLTLEQMCQKYDALGGINAGGFVDDGGAGLGGLPEGLTIVDGVCYNEGYGGDSFAGLSVDNILHVGYFSLSDVQYTNIRDGVSFGPILIRNGEPTNPKYLSSGVNPRTAIGQRSDGAILMLVIDGRQAHSIGATYQDCVDIMLDYGAVNACNMDGGSSTSLWMNGDYVNSCSSQSGESRPLPTAFLIRKLDSAEQSGQE